MIGRFSIEEIMIRILPGGFLLAFLFFQTNFDSFLTLDQNLDFLYTFIFFCTSFIIGELLQTIAHELEWVIGIFFKFRTPSEVFLYKNNPVIKNDHSRNELLEHLSLPEAQLTIFQKEYSKVSILLNRKKDDDNLAQSIFWKLYSKVSDLEEIKTCNRNYLFVRVICITFLIIAMFLFINEHVLAAFISMTIFLVFLWRSRGIARGLVFKTVLLNLK